MYYTAIYLFGEKNFFYSFEAENDEAALDFCKWKFSVPTSQIIIIENIDLDASSECGRVVFANNKFITNE